MFKLGGYILFANTPDSTKPQPNVEDFTESLSTTMGSPAECQVALSVTAGTVAAVEQSAVAMLGYVPVITMFPASYKSTLIAIGPAGNP